MSKRIRELIELSYNAGWISGQIETGLLPPVKLVQRQDQQAGIAMARNAARDALEADITAVIDCAQALADQARQYSGCDLADRADALDAAVAKMLGQP